MARRLERDMEPVVEAMYVQPKQKGCWGRFCQTIKRMTTRRVATEAGGRKTKRLRKKYKKTRNIKKKQIKKNDV